MFDVADLTEPPGNKLRLHTLCHEVTVTEIVSWNLYEHSHGYVRVGNLRFMVFDYEGLLLSSGALTDILILRFPLHSPTSFRADTIQTC